MWTLLQSGDELPETVEEGVLILITNFKTRKEFKQECIKLANDNHVPHSIIFLLPIVGRVPESMYEPLLEHYANHSKSL